VESQKKIGEQKITQGGGGGGADLKRRLSIDGFAESVHVIPYKLKKEKAKTW